MCYLYSGINALRDTLGSVRIRIPDYRYITLEEYKAKHVPTNGNTCFKGTGTDWR